jgi:hypothetical protein
LPFSVIVESNGMNDALFCCQSAPEYDREWRLYAVWCALQVKHLMTDPRSFAALEVSERFANGLATQAEMAAAWDAARAAASSTAWDAARAAAWDAARAAQKIVFLWVVTGGLAEWEAKP